MTLQFNILRDRVNQYQFVISYLSLRYLSILLNTVVKYNYKLKVVFLQLSYVLNVNQFNPLNTKRRLLYLKTQFVPRSKHFISVIKTNQFML